VKIRVNPWLIFLCVFCAFSCRKSQLTNQLIHQLTKSPVANFSVLSVASVAKKIRARRVEAEGEDGSIRGSSLCALAPSWQVISTKCAAIRTPKTADLKIFFTPFAAAT
jgi:hypothetical protein